MLHKLYILFIAPRQQHEDVRNRELVLNVLYSGTLVALLLSIPIFLYNYFFLHKAFAPGRMLWVLCVVAFVSALYGLARSGRYRISAFLLVAVYFLLAGTIVLEWGITTPTGLLLFGLVIVLAGILLGARYSLYAAGVVIAFLCFVHGGTTHGVLHPDLSWTVAKPEIGDVVAFSLIFSFMAVLSWLFNYQMERSLHRAERAESALKKQKASLEDTVTERTRQLQAEQLEKIQQMYRFAELGQLSTALLHELANHLTTIMLDIEGLDASKTTMLKRAKRSIHYIEDMVHRVRDQLNGKTQSQIFNVASETDNVVNILQHKAAQSFVTLRWQLPADKKEMRCRGDSLRFRQLMANLISNGIEAYPASDTSSSQRVVEIVLSSRGKHITVTVNDWGKGIAEAERTKLFEPFYSTKKTGMGMGLFIARQITEQHLNGRLNMDSTVQHTAFVIALPRTGA